MKLDVIMTNGNDNAACDDCSWEPTNEADSARQAAATHARATGHTTSARVEFEFTYRPSSRSGQPQREDA